MENTCWVKGLESIGTASVVAHIAHAIESTESDHLDLGCHESIAYRFIAQQIRAEVFLVVVGQHRDDDGIAAHFVLNLQRTEYIGTRRNTHPESGVVRQLARHQDGIAIIHADDAIELAQIHDGRNKFVGNSLDAMMSHAMSRRERR